MAKPGRTTSRKRFRGMVFLWGMASVAVPMSASAYETLGYWWDASEYAFYADTASFDSFVDDTAELDLTPTDYEWYITYAASQWSYRTGADITVTYLGTTDSGCVSGDGDSVICAIATCGAMCTSRGQMVPVRDPPASSNLIEADVQIHGNHVWDIEADIPDDADNDLLGTLVHEIGHAFGLGHDVDSAMEPWNGWDDGTTDSDGPGTGNALRRSLYGDDIDGIRSIYGTRTMSEYMREWNSSGETLGASFSRPGSVFIPTTGTIVRDGGATNYYVLRAAVNSAGTRVYVDSTAYQASGSSNWTSYYYLHDGWHPPAIAADDHATDGTVSLVLPNELTTYDGTCNGIKSWTSTSRFANATTEVTNDICTNHGVGLGYDPTSNRWVLAYVVLRDDEHAEEDDQAAVFMRTSSNGRTWSSTTETDTGYYTIDAPSIACNTADGCILSIVDAGASTDKPTVRNTKFTVDASPYTLTLGSSYLEGAQFTARTPTVGVNSDGDFYQWLYWTSSYALNASGGGSVYRRTSATIPFSYTGWTSMSETTSVRPGIGHSYERVYSYMCLVE